ncbi:MAG: hypothetical protein L0H31_17050 [Nocardioidaceae bacterium]|nr:hypothetical protein [Nocardioidaceae bacterium]
MTSYDIAVALLRRWWLLAIGVVLTGTLATLISQSPPIYWTTYDMNLVAPDRSGAAYSRTPAPYGVTPVAGVLEVLLAGNHDAAAAATQEVPIFGLDHEFGFDVRAKDKGLQWSRDYVAALTVQISAPSREAVLSQVEGLGQRAQAELRTLQDDQEVPPEARLTLEEPEAVDIVKISPSYIRAVAGTVVLGLGSSVVATITLDRWLLARRRLPSQRRK